MCAGLLHLINPAVCCAIIVNPGDQCISFPFNNSGMNAALHKRGWLMVVVKQDVTGRCGS